jgi:hypothetical protein
VDARQRSRIDARADVDVTALTATGKSPTVLAFALGSHADSRSPPSTAGGLAVPAAHPTALPQALAGQVRHDAQWPDRMAELLAD